MFTTLDDVDSRHFLAVCFCSVLLFSFAAHCFWAAARGAGPGGREGSCTPLPF